MHKKTIHVAERLILLAPLLVAFLWMGYIVVNSSSPANESFAPSIVSDLVTALFVFIVTYAIILAILFYLMSRSSRKSTLMGVSRKGGF